MTGIVRAIFIILAVLVLLALIALGLAWWLVDTEAVHQRAEQALAEASGMDVHLSEPPRLAMGMRPALVVSDVELQHDGERVLAVDRVRVELSFGGLAGGSLQPVAVDFDGLHVRIQRHGPGDFNVRRMTAPDARLEAGSLKRLRLTDASMRFHDRPSDVEWRLEHCDAELTGLRYPGGPIEELVAGLEASGTLTCQRFELDDLQFTDLVSEFQAGNGHFEFQPLSVRGFQADSDGRLEVDWSGQDPAFHLEQNLVGMALKDLVALLEGEHEAEGALDLEVSLSATGRQWQRIRGSAEGRVRLAGRNLVFSGMDLDQELDDYAATQRFELVDVGAAVLVGPAGLMATRGYAFAGLLDDPEGRTQIDELLSEWRMDDGTARATDAAFRTGKNRLALTGGLDFVDMRFDDLVAAVVDDEGCAVVEQRVRGSFAEPEVKRPDFLVTVIGPLLDLVEQGARAITDADCEVFYDGAVAHPQ